MTTHATACTTTAPEDDEIDAIERLGTLAAEAYETLCDFETFEDSRLEEALVRAVRALDDLCFLTCEIVYGDEDDDEQTGSDDDALAICSA